MSNLLDEALAYLRRGWSVIPIGKDKRSALLNWKKYQAQRPTEGDLRLWFAKPNVTGIGIICGEVSDELVVRDFDLAESYYGWKKAYPELASALPTVRTGKGFHVYFRNGHRRIKNIGDGEGELRGAGYVLAPPSLHPSGVVYNWVVPLPDGRLPEVDPFAVGLAGHGGDTSPSPPPTHPYGSVVSVVSVTTPGAQEAIGRTLPTGTGQRNGQVFRLARALKGIPSLADAPAEAFREVVWEWYRLARPHIGTKVWEVTWSDFLNAWPKVVFPEGQGLMAEILKRADASDLPPIAAQYEAPATHRLIKLCRELQRASGDRPFFLACRTVQDLLGIDFMTASRRLRMLVADGILAVVEPGTKRRAARYRYIADSGETAMLGNE